jgi:O-antigen/teichoic acid export membrane protein
LLSIISDVSVVGVYKFAKRLVEPINYITTAFNPWIQSQYSAGKKINFNDLVIKLLLPVSLAIMLIFIFAGRKIILLIGSSDFNLAYESLIILASGYIIYLLTFWIRQSLLFNELIMHHVRGRVLYSLVFVALSVPLANTYSANGLSLSLSIAILFQKVYELYIYKKKIVPKSLH